MKILIVSFPFPPFNTSGAVRVGKMAKYLLQAGHELRVLTADHQPWMLGLPVEIEEKYIVKTDWIDVNKPIQLLLGGKKNVAKKGYEGAGGGATILKRLGPYYKDLLNLPDGQIGWYPFALSAGKKLLESWRPDFIVASSPPPTSLLVAKKLSRLYHIPWVADLRDLWADNHYAERSQSVLRGMIDRKIEKYVLSSANGLVTISEPLADALREKFSIPVGVITNGYDLSDYPKAPERTEGGSLQIVYTGIIYPGKRDPTPLFQALSLLGKDAEKIKVDFYGRGNASIRQAAIMQGVEHLVNCHNMVPYQEALRLQVSADVLLQLTYNSNKEVGIMTGKFFEYLGARRPILLLGCTDGVAANIIKDRRLGLAENNPVEIAAFLKKCIEDKENGIENQFPPEAAYGFSRQEQAEKLIGFLESLK